MPQKQNPVRPSAMVALANQNAALRSGLAAAGMHQHQRDGGAWFTEWMLVPQIALATTSALKHAIALAREMQPNTERMRAALSGNFGLIHAEALSFALAERMPRPDAQAATKDLCRQAMEGQTSLADLAHARFPDLPDGLFQPHLQLGQAPAEANRFVERVRAL
jgi:3-carboxy-cis,cis-muconate cycloisomerase